MNDILPAEARAVLDFWFAPVGDPEHGTQRKMWFIKKDATDRRIAERFGRLIEQALRGELDHWSAQLQGGLARIIVLDQFTRNAFRGTPRSFAGDSQALSAAHAMVESRQDEQLDPVARSFVYLPFEHAESTPMQAESVRLFSRLEPLLPGAELLKYAERHRDVIARFGRFPHRNRILGRVSTAEELQFLTQPGARF